ncbi:hypothetical protein GGR54DRAFT_649273 [Hypoxylon sp. NC1633]|nr:hypothetical protein GGR54DRAFT_649273 [Hypoxylon sp. NC1633]
MQQVLPFVQVRDLPSSASFYSAITQPLKLRYISANSSSIVFGDTTSPYPDPVLEVRKVGAGQPLRPSRVVLSAHSPSVVSAFRAAALRADPSLPVDSDGGNYVEITDFDGNKIEVVCRSSSGYPDPYESSRTASISPAGSSLALRGSQSVMRRSHTTSTVQTTAPRDSPRGFGTSTSSSSSFGTVLGAAAVGVAVGGALTYAMMRNDRQRAPHQDFDPSPPTTFHRRASYPDPQPSSARPRYEIEYPPGSPRKYPPPSYGARYAHAHAQLEGGGGGTRTSRALEDIDDRASRRSSHGHGTSSRARRSSEAGSARRPLMITEAEHRSSTGSSSQHRDARKLLLGDDDDSRRSRSRAPSKYSATVTAGRPVDADRRSASTARPRAPSQHSTATATRAWRSGSRSRGTSYASARDVPLPESRAVWDEGDDDDDDDAASVAPSDSISCVGGSGGHSRRSRRNSVAGGGGGGGVAGGSMVGRYRKVLNEFDDRRRPLYGSEYN